MKVPISFWLSQDAVYHVLQLPSVIKVINSMSSTTFSFETFCDENMAFTSKFVSKGCWVYTELNCMARQTYKYLNSRWTRFAQYHIIAGLVLRISCNSSMHVTGPLYPLNSCRHFCVSWLFFFPISIFPKVFKLLRSFCLWTNLFFHCI